MSDRVFSALLIVGLMTASGPSRAASVAALFGGAEFRFGQTKAEYRQPGMIANVPVGGSTAVTPIFNTGTVTGIVGQFNPGRFETVKEFLKARYADPQCAPTRVYANPTDPATGFTNEVCIFAADDGLILLSRANPVFVQQGMPATSFNPDISALLAVRSEDAQTALRLIPHDGSKGPPPVAAPVVEPVESHDVAAAPSRSTDHRTPLDKYSGDTAFFIMECSLKFRLASSLADLRDSGGSPPPLAPGVDADYMKCISDGGESARAKLKPAILTVKKEKAREALKTYHVAFISALEGIAPGFDEPKILYQQRQQTLNDKRKEAWSRFEIEE
jgi:hypothetical protein